MQESALDVRGKVLSKKFLSFALGASWITMSFKSADKCKCKLGLVNRRESSGGMEWLGYGIAFFRALNLQISVPEIWRKSLFVWKFRDFLEISASENYFSDSEKIGVPYATNPYPH